MTWLAVVVSALVAVGVVVGVRSRLRLRRDRAAVKAAILQAERQAWGPAAGRRWPHKQRLETAETVPIRVPTQREPPP